MFIIISEIKLYAYMCFLKKKFLHGVRTTGTHKQNLFIPKFQKKSVKLYFLKSTKSVPYGCISWFSLYWWKVPIFIYNIFSFHEKTRKTREVMIISKKNWQKMTTFDHCIIYVPRNNPP